MRRNVNASEPQSTEHSDDNKTYKRHQHHEAMPVSSSTDGSVKKVTILMRTYANPDKSTKISIDVNIDKLIEQTYNLRFNQSDF